MAVSNSEIKKRVAIGTVWMMLLKVAVRGIGILSTIILARLLLPEDYGIVAMALAFYALIEMLAAFGFDFMLVQKQSITREDYDSAFTARLICYIILAIIVLLSAHPVASFYGESALANILYALAFQMFLSGLDNIALVDFRREMMFDKEFKYQVAVKVVGFVVTVALAYTLRSYWALIIGSISLRFANIIFGYYFRPYRPRICFTKTKEIMSFSKWLLLMNFASYFRSQLPNIVLGKFVSTRAVGIYSMGAEIGQTSSQEIVAAMNRPVYSGFAKLASNLSELQKNFLDVLGFQALIVLAMGFGVGATSELVVEVALGVNWLDLGEPLILLSLGYALGAISSCCIYIYMAQGHPRYCFVVSLIGLIVFAPQVIIFVDMYGMMGVVIAHAITCAVSTLIAYSLAASVLQMSTFRILSVVLRPLFGASLMFLVERNWVMPFLRDWAENIYLALLLSVIAGAIVYIVSVLGLWLMQGKPDSAERQLMTFVWSKLKGQGLL